MAGLVEIHNIPAFVDGVEEEAVMEELLADESFLQDEGEEEEEEELVTVTKKKGRRGADRALPPDPRHPAVEGGHQHLQVRQGHPGRGAQGEDG